MIDLMMDVPGWAWLVFGLIACVSAASLLGYAMGINDAWRDAENREEPK